MSRDEQNILVEWLQNLNDKELIDLASKEFDINTLQHHLDYIDKHHITGQDVHTSWANFQDKIGQSNGRETIKNRSKLLRLAIALFIPILICGIYYAYVSYKEAQEKQITKSINTEIAQSIIEYAPDSSKIVLGGKSFLKYYPARWPEERKLWLEGEAMFDVIKGSTFEVITPKGTVRVVGTEFNVLNYGKYIKVTCYEGRVILSSLSGNAKYVDAGEELILTEESFGEKIKHQEKAPGWVDGNINYTAQPLSLITHEMERYYHKKIVIADKLSKKQFSGSLPINDWGKMIKILEGSMSFQTKIDESGNVVFE